MQKEPRSAFETAGLGAFGCLLLVLLVVLGFVLWRLDR